MDKRKTGYFPKYVPEAEIAQKKGEAVQWREISNYCTSLPVI